MKQLGLHPFSVFLFSPYTALAVACQDSDIRNVSALIIGPPDTPYEFGFFEVGGFLLVKSRTLLTNGLAW